MSRSEEVCVIGAGGHAKVVIRAIQLLGMKVVAVFDDDPAREGQSVFGGPVVGPIRLIEDYAPLPTVIAVGDNCHRKLLAERLDLPWMTVVHPDARVDATAQLGRGTVVMAGAILQADCCVGEHAIVNTGASVDHDCRIGDYAHLGPRTCLCGAVTVGEGSLLGVGASAIPSIRIGAWTVVGAGAAVVSDLPDRVLAIGTPARVEKQLTDSAPKARDTNVGHEQDAVAGASRIFLSPPHMSPRERELLIAAFDSNWIAPLGPEVDGFEREFATAVGAAHAVAVSSGTAALHLALLVLGAKPGDEVITSTLTFSATANAISYCGAAPVFIDSDRTTWNMDPSLLEEELDACARRGKRPAAVVVVDLYGQCAEYDAILAACRKYDVPLIEDAAEALGATYRDRAAGRFGVVGCFSFNGNKIITTSGGGMLISDRAELVERARFLATQARDPAPHYEHSHVGYNYRMSNLLAAVGRGQLAILPERVAQRRANFEYYRRALGDLPGIEFMPEGPNGRSTRWLTCALIDQTRFGANRDDILQTLGSANIEARPVWKPMHLQPVFAHCRARGGAVAEDLFQRGLCLPSGSSLTEEDRLRVVRGIRATARCHADTGKCTRAFRAAG